MTTVLLIITNVGFSLIVSYLTCVVFEYQREKKESEIEYNKAMERYNELMRMLVDKFKKDFEKDNRKK